jgi:predicted deacylase
MARFNEADMDRFEAIFLNTYEESRTRFRQQLARLQSRWPLAMLGRYAVAGDDSTTLDWIEAPPTGPAKRCLIVTTGLHGAEGLAGAAALQRLIELWLPTIDPDACGLLLVHAINPWGMRHFRKVNPHNVDLNRNFLDFTDTLPANDDYRLLDEFLASPQPVGFRWPENLTFLGLVLRLLVEYGFDRIKRATLLGQYEFPRGLYFGGQSMQEETEAIIDLVMTQLSRYPQTLHLDMHTGYGPRGQATLVISPEDERPSSQLQHRYNYPWVSKTNPQEFFAIQGDMIDYFTRRAANEYPGHNYMGMAIEYGTLGESLWALADSLQATMLENRLYHYGATSDKAAAWAQRRYREFYYPSDSDWRASMMADTDRALEGVLRAEGFIP